MSDDKDGKVYTTRTGAPLLGIKQDTLKIWAIKSGIGSQPGGPGTAYLFTHDDLLAIRKWRIENGQHSRPEFIQRGEDLDELGLGPFYDPDNKLKRYPY